MASRIVKRARVAAQNAAAVPLATVVRVVGPRIRFVLLYQPRSGSELLASLLDSHPDIRCESEILTSRPARLRPDCYVEGRALRNVFAGRVSAYGFKAATLDLVALSKAGFAPFVPRMHALGYRFVYLRRRDVLLQVVSLQQAVARNEWHHRANEAARFRAFTVDPERIVRSLELAEERSTFTEQQLAGVEHTGLVYENDLESPARWQPTVDRLCDVFGLARHPVTSDLLRMSPRTKSI